MITKSMLSALLVSAALSAGCATTSGDLAASDGARDNPCSRAVVGSRIRNCRSPGHTADRSIMEQQIHRCSGAPCEGGGE